jgi:ubiquinone/menaquinone biosynthesis C-methylase UbiE
MEDHRNKIVHAVKDYAISQQTFGLYHDPKTDLLITFPKPKPETLAAYYKSDNYISHTDSRNTLFDKLYQFVKSFTIQSKIKLVEGFLQANGSVLDIGCGTGEFLLATQKKGWESTGVEISTVAKQLSENKLIKVYDDSLHLADNSFDVITMWHVLEHVYDVDAQISELKRLLKQDGTLIIAVPNHKSFDAKHYGRHWAGYDVPRHLLHFSKNSIKILFEKHGCRLVQTLPMWFDAFYVSLLSEKYKTGTININGFWIGLKSNWKARRTKQYSSHIYTFKVK